MLDDVLLEELASMPDTSVISLNDIDIYGTEMTEEKKHAFLRRKKIIGEITKSPENPIQSPPLFCVWGKGDDIEHDTGRRVENLDRKSFPDHFAEPTIQQKASALQNNFISALNRSKTKWKLSRGELYSDDGHLPRYLVPNDKVILTPSLFLRRKIIGRDFLPCLLTK